MKTLSQGNKFLGEEPLEKRGYINITYSRHFDSEGILWPKSDKDGDQTEKRFNVSRGENAEVDPVIKEWVE